MINEKPEKANYLYLALLTLGSVVVIGISSAFLGLLVGGVVKLFLLGYNVW